MSGNLNSVWEFVPAARCYEIFARDVASCCPGFSLVRNGVLVKKTSPDISHVLQFMRYKGGAYGLRWGALLTYLPSQWKNRLSWSRSPKTLTFDLWEQAGDDMDNPAILPADPAALYATFMDGEDRFTRDLRRVWAILGTYIFDWLNRLTGLPEVLALAERQARRDWHGPQHFPPPALVHAFTLARMGRFEPALDEFQTLTAENELDPNGNLLRALKKISDPSG